MNSGAIAGNHIFIIEDDVFMQYVLKRVFSNTCLLTVFNDGHAAWLALQSGIVPNLIITDLNIPLLTGMQLLLKVRESAHLSHVPVIMMSADNSTDVRWSSLSAGASDYLVKPFEPNDLARRANHIINTDSRQMSLLHA